MSWFGETFGDSLNNLKGQITKITKEVLADEENANNSEGSDLLVKELEALCESKDLEISSLRDELDKLQSQRKSEFEDLKGKICSQASDSKTQLLENELVELRKERNHLNLCVDELQSEYQTNLEQVISVRDKYKTELEDLKNDYNLIKKKLDELLENQSNKKEIENDELSLLMCQIESLQLELESTKKDKEISLKEINEGKVSYNSLKVELEKSLEDKQKTEEDNKTIKIENKRLKDQLRVRLKENEEMQIIQQNLLKENKELLNKVESYENVKFKLSGEVSQADVEKKLKNLLEMFNVKIEKETSENTFDYSLHLIEKEWRIIHDNLNKANMMVDENTQSLKSEIKKLTDENKKLCNEMRITMDTLAETERKYQGEIATLKNIISEMKTQQQDCIKQSQTDDVKRLEQEVAHYKCMTETKNQELMDILKMKSDLEQELNVLKSVSVKTEQDLFMIGKKKEELEAEVEILKSRESELNRSKVSLEERLRMIESENLELKQKNTELNCKIIELEENLCKLNTEKALSKTLDAKLNEVILSRTVLENHCAELQKQNNSLQNELGNVKTEFTFLQKNFAELMKSNSGFQEEIQKLQGKNEVLEKAEVEMKKWKDACVDLEVQRQDILARKEELEKEILVLKNHSAENLEMKDPEISLLKQANANLIESLHQLQQELASKKHAENLHVPDETKSESEVLKQLNLELQEENNELKCRIQKFQDQMKTHMVHLQNQQTIKSDILQHKRSRSAVDFESTPDLKIPEKESKEVYLLKQTVHEEQAKYRLLANQFQEISEKESNARKEFERLKQHLIEIEDHYTEEAVENKKVIDDLKSKLVAAEEQLKNSSTLYTSVKVRDNQHLESLQSQVRLISAQRDDLQAKLSVAEDEVQKHKASLMSLQIVLEQFQQEKEREVEGVAIKYEKQIQSSNNRFMELEMEIDALKKQLSEAKNGLHAASRLGELLEKKAQQVTELEENLSLMRDKVKEVESNLAAANESNSGKIDKSLIKNLVLGYVLSQKGDRKSQVLRIMASVLDFDRDERTKVGVDNAGSSWLPNAFHFKSEGGPNNQSFSEAFIKFLENESRPQPQVKFHPEQFEANKAKPSSASPKPAGLISELVLPTFNSSQENQSSVILKNVLKDS